MVYESLYRNTHKICCTMDTAGYTYNSTLKDTLKSVLPPSLKRVIEKGLNLYRDITATTRVLPDFIIIGGQRCGTTSVYMNLINHPCVAPAFRKEVHFFDNNFSKGVTWYRAHFPSSVYKYVKVRKVTFVTGEATPYYIFHPCAPQRIFNTVPRAKLIVILRNPVDRAYSHYHHEVRIGVENLSFEDAIKKEEERLRGEAEKMLENENYYSFNHQHYSYLARGIYVDQLKTWMSIFPRKQILILRNFFDDPPAGLKKVYEFLGLPDFESKYKKYSCAQYPKMSTDMRKHLTDYFEPHNQRLYEYLGTDLGWNR